MCTQVLLWHNFVASLVKVCSECIHDVLLLLLLLVYCPQSTGQS